MVWFAGILFMNNVNDEQAYKVVYGYQGFALALPTENALCAYLLLCRVAADFVVALAHGTPHTNLNLYLFCTTFVPTGCTTATTI